MASKIQEKIAANITSVIENKFDELKSEQKKEIQDNIEKPIIGKTTEMVTKCHKEIKDLESRLNVLENKSY